MRREARLAETPTTAGYPHASGPIGILLDGLDLDVCHLCDACGNRCTLDVPMTEAEFEAIEDFLDLRTASRREAKGERHEARGHGQDRADMEEVWGPACRFRDQHEGLCLIYPVRPLICRLMGHVWWLPCPIDRVPHSAADSTLSAALDDYCRLERIPYEDRAQRRGYRETPGSSPRSHCERQ